MAQRVLLPWIEPTKLCNKLLNFNENATNYVIFNDAICMLYFIYNKNAFHYCKSYILNLPQTDKNYQTYLCRFVMVEHPDIVDFINMVGYNENMFGYMCKNPYCIKFIEENKHNYSINMIHLAQNKGAIHLIRKYIDQFTPPCWEYLCKNESPDAIQILKENPDKIRWYILSTNPSAIKILEENKELIDYMYLSINPAAIHLIEKNMDKIHWQHLSQNPKAIHILEKYQDKIDWYSLSQNPAIFDYDFKHLSEIRTNILREELIKKTMHPSKIQYWLENGLTIDDLF